MKKNSVTKNAMWIIGCRIAQSFLGLIITMMSARYLGPSNYGLINYAASVVAFVAPFMKMGFNHVLVREIIINKDREGEILGTAIIYNICSAILCIVGVTLFAYLANEEESKTMIVCMLYSFNLFFQATEMIQYWFQAKLIAHYTAIASLTAYVVVSVYKIYLLVMGKSIEWFAIAQSLDYFLISLILMISYYKLKGQKLSFSFSRGMKMFCQSKYFIISSMMITIFANTDKLMIKNMLGDTATGYYSAAITCAGVLSFVYSAIIESMRPVVLESKSKSKVEYEKNMSRLFSIVFYLSLCQCLFMTVLARPIMLILYGLQYEKSIVILRVVVWYVTYSYLGSARDVWILAEGKQKHLWLVNLLGALLNVIANIIFTPLYGCIGAAIASFITQFFINFLFGFIFEPFKECNALIIKGINPVFAITEFRVFINNRIKH